FTTDASQIRLEALRKCSRNHRDPQTQAAIAGAAIDAIAPLIAVDAYPAATQMALLAKTAATAAQSERLLALAQEYGPRLGKMDRAFLKLKDQRARLKSQPDDPEANTAVGLFQCSIVGNWSRAAEYLARGTAPLRHAAADELSLPTSARAQTDLAESW